VAIGLATTVIVVIAGYVFLVRDGGRAGPNDLLAQSREAMASASFSFVVNDCPTCPPPVIAEYAPPDRFKLSGNKRREEWPYYLVLGGMGYV
jgi:hypothetical protein